MTQLLMREFRWSLTSNTRIGRSLVCLQSVPDIIE